MAKESRKRLKTYFQTGDQPTESEFVNWFDSQLILSGSNGITGSLIISGSTNDNADGSVPMLYVMGDITSSGNISASGTIYADNFTSTGGDVSGITFTDSMNLTGDLTASGYIHGKLIIPKDKAIYLEDDAGNWTDTAIINNLNTGITFGDTDYLATINGNGLDINSGQDIKIDSDNGDIQFQDSDVTTVWIDSTSGHITASGDISASGYVYAKTLYISSSVGGPMTKRIIWSNETSGANNLVMPDTGLVVMGRISGTHITASGNISASGHITASGNMYALAYSGSDYLHLNSGGKVKTQYLIRYSDGNPVVEIEETGINITGEITASGNISSSGYISASAGHFGLSSTTVDDNIYTTGNITASGNISSSLTSTGSFGRVESTAFSATTITATHGEFSTINTTEITSSIVTSSVIYSSGSNIFGDESIDSHLFNGSITASGNISSSGHIYGMTYISDGNEVLKYHETDITLPGNTKVYGGVSASGYIIAQHITASGNISSSGTGQFGDDITITSGSINLETFSEGLQFYNGVDYTSNRINLTTAENLQFRCGGVFQFDENIQLLDGHLMRLKNTGNGGSMDLLNSQATDRLDFKTGSKFLMSISSSGDVSSSGTIEAGGHITATSADYVKIEVNQTDSGKATLAVASGTSELALISTTNNASYDADIKFVTNDGSGGNQERMRIKEDGKVGIGNSSPPEALSVTGNISASGHITTPSHITASGNISASGTLYAADSVIYNNSSVLGDITASGNISASGDIIGDHFIGQEGYRLIENNGSTIAVGNQNSTTIRFGKNANSFNFIGGGAITASSNISASGNIETNNIVTNAGNLDITVNTNEGDIQFKSDDGSTGTTVYFRVDGSEVNTRFIKDLKLSDNVKALVGGSDDLQIYHNATDSIIENKTGNLLLSASANERIKFVGNITASGAISASGDVYSTNHEAVWQGSVHVDSSAEALWYGPSVVGLYNNLWNVDYGNDAAAVTLPCESGSAGIVVPFKSKLVGFRAMTTAIAAEKVTIGLFHEPANSSTFNKTTAGAAGDATLVCGAKASSDTPGTAGNPMSITKTDASQSLAAGDMLYPRVKGGASGAYVSFTVLIQREK